MIPPQAHASIEEQYTELEHQGYTLLSEDHTLSPADGSSEETEAMYAATFGSMVTISSGMTLTSGSRITPIEFLTDDFLADWVHAYAYDDYHRLTAKKIPGKDSIYLVYDAWDRVVLSSYPEVLEGCLYVHRSGLSIHRRHYRIPHDHVLRSLRLPGSSGLGHPEPGLQ